ncbi:MAG: LysM peptidoglycan-binding domain-containing protein [Solirubrobacteraceae bacterium]|nr:LysM peptidoglycan-binding domain-containing protein [Solirubrobacteraceae bacterium]
MLRRTLIIALGAFGLGTPAADAHLVQPGETLSGIAAANGMSPAALAAANGVAADAWVISGTTLNVPAPGTAPVAPAAPAPSAPAPAAQAAAPAPTAGTTVIQPGETLSAIAARLGTTPAALAVANGISDPNLILAGTTLRPSGAAPAAAASSPSSVPGAAVASSTGPEGGPAATGVGATPTGERLSSSQISQIAGQHGAPGDLAAAIAWQESGNNNALTSSAGARGIMQVMPGTWDWINSSLAQPPLNRASASDNVRAGSLLIRQLLNETGGDVATAVAGYYQGLGSVRRNGLYDDTKQYVNNVLSLRGRMG